MNTHVQKIFLTVFLSVLGTIVCDAQSYRDSTARFRVYFHVDQSDLDLSHMGNSLTLNEMDNVLDSLLRGHVNVKVSVEAGASPEGTEGGNLKLADARTARLRLYLLTHHPRLDEKDLRLSSRAADWDGLANVIQRSRYPWREDALLIIRNTPVWIHDRSGAVVDSKKKQLMDLKGGNPWREMERDIFPYLRRADVALTWSLPAQEPQKDTLVMEEHRSDTLVIQQIDTVLVEKHYYESSPAPKHGFVLYSNLLYDFALAPSIGTQIHFGAGWAVGASWTGAWWSASQKNRFYRVYGAEVSVRKYFTLPSDNAAGAFRSMTGHHAGLCANLFTYDFELGGKGYLGGIPGEGLFAAPTWSVGAEYGYTLPLSSHFNLDFSLGIGYMQGLQNLYNPEEEEYVRTDTRMFRWWGPVRAEVTLYWLMGFENNKKNRHE